MGVGRTFQVVRSFPRLPVLDNVIVGADGAGLSDRDAIASTVRALHQVGLHDESSVAAGQLTNKQLRLMELARALAGRPRLLLLDETLAGLGREVAPLEAGAGRRTGAGTEIGAGGRDVDRGRSRKRLRRRGGSRAAAPPSRIGRRSRDP